VLEGVEGRPKMMKKERLIQELEEEGLIDKNASVGAKHSKLKGLLNSISIAGSDNPLVEVEYKGKQRNREYFSEYDGVARGQMGRGRRGPKNTSLRLTPNNAPFLIS